MACSSKNDEPLTKEQQELVSKNHDLIYSYAIKKRVSVAEYYDVLAIGLCKAAKAFDENKGAFSTLAYKCMENELLMYFNQLQKLSATPSNVVLSYDALNCSENIDNQNGIIDYGSYNDMMASAMFREFIEELNENEKKILKHLIKGLTHYEIAEIINCSRQNIDYHVKNMRNKANKYFNYN